MRTDDLVTLLARNPQPVAAGSAARRLAVAIAVGLVGAAAIMSVRLGLNPALAVATTTGLFWLKVGFVAVLLAISTVAARRLGTPGARTAPALAALAAPLLVLWLIAGVILLQAPPSERAPLALGTTWRVCALNIAMLSIPAFAASLWAMKGLAPTQLQLAGAGAGLLAGATGTLVYTLHCPEMAPPFIAIWYVLGMLIPTAAGALLGPRVLRW
ncbi:MAG: NrsF family protein [Rhodospirillaceae bacterium]